MRLIDADALIENCDIMVGNITIGRRDYVMFHEIDSAPSIDIEPKRGEWIDYSCGSGCYCSNCGWDGDDIIDECIIQDFDFCPNCGASMREREGK